MARTKQTATKNTGGKPLAMGRGKAKAVEAKVVDTMGARAPSQDLCRAVVVLVEEAVVLVGDSQESEVEMTMMMTLTSAGRWGMKADHRGHLWLVRSNASQAQLTPQLTETYHLSISLIRRRELGWAIACWTGLQHRGKPYTRQGCRGGW